MGSAIANRMIRERHTVTILDDLSTGDRSRVHGRYTFYQADVADGRCRRLFEDNRFDVVVHCANSTAYASGAAFTRRSATNSLGLQNMLEFSRQNGVGQFVFLSSYRVYAQAKERSAKTRPPVPPRWPWRSDFR